MAKILVAEDDPAYGRLLARLFGEAGHTVQMAGNGIEALHQCASFAPDLLVCDLMMPEMDGVEVIRRLRGQPGRPLIIAISGGANHLNLPMLLQSAALLGAEQVFHKPVANEELLLAVTHLLAPAGPERDHFQTNHSTAA